MSKKIQKIKERELEMQELKVIRHEDQRILLTSQIAEAYETTDRRISENFNANKEHYIVGKHYYCLEGEILKQFKSEYGNSVIAQNINKLYLWTEKGAFLHAKSLNTDKAWEVYDILVDTYFEVNEHKPMCLEDLIIANAKALKDAREQAEQAQATALEAKQEVQAIRDAIVLDPAAWRSETTSLINRIAQKLGGNDNIQAIRKESYDLLDSRAKAKLGVRQVNMKRKVLEETGSTSKANKITKLDVIAGDARLREVYIAIVKEMAIKYGVA